MAMTNPVGRLRHVRIAIVVMAVILAALAMTYVVASTRLVRAQVKGDRNLLDTGAIPTGRPDKMREALIVEALATNPLGQSVLNALLVERSRAAARPMSKAEADILLRLGWRDDAALRNVAEVYADGSNLPRLLDVLDALLRRNKIGEPVSAVLETMEAEPRFRPALVNKLAQDPPWRSFFFRVGANGLTSREAAGRRLKTFLALEHTRKPPSEIETAAMLPVLHAQGFGAEAFDLWQDERRRARQPLFARPLTDPRFTRAAALQEGNGVATVYDWTAEYGDGFDIGFGSDPARLRIEWDGRGVPVFVRQRTSAFPGTSRLTVVVGGETTETDAIGYRLVCPEAAVELRRIRTQGQATLYGTDAQVPCAFPMFEIFGRVQNYPHDVQAELTQVTLSRN